MGNFGFVVEKLEEMETVEQRIAEAPRLFSIFMGQYVPTGAINPRCWHLNKDPSDSRIREGFGYYDDFWEKVKELFDGTLPEEIESHYKNFCRNLKRTKELLELDDSARRTLLIHEMFPFWGNFNEAVHKMFRHKWEDFNVSELNFSTEPLGTGGYASIYKAKQKPYVLKLFHHLARFNGGLGDQQIRRRQYELINHNIGENKELFHKEPFIPVRANSYIYRGDLNGDTVAYVMDFFEGESFSKIIEKVPEKLNKELVGKALLTYALMLEKVHALNKVFIDPAWDNLLVKGDEMKICDVDFLTSIDKLDGNLLFPAHQAYASYEHCISQQPTFSGDLEGLALMAHHAIIGESFIDTSTWETQYENRKKAKANQRNYTSKYKKRLSKNLRDIVTPLITYPRDNSITASDFVSAIKMDCEF